MTNHPNRSRRTFDAIVLASKIIRSGSCIALQDATHNAAIITRYECAVMVLVAERNRFADTGASLASPAYKALDAKLEAVRKGLRSVRDFSASLVR